MERSKKLSRDTAEQHHSTIFTVKSKQFVIPSWLDCNWQFLAGLNQDVYFAEH